MDDEMNAVTCRSKFLNEFFQGSGGGVRTQTMCDRVTDFGSELSILN